MYTHIKRKGKRYQIQRVLGAIAVVDTYHGGEVISAHTSLVVARIACVVLNLGVDG